MAVQGLEMLQRHKRLITALKNQYEIGTGNQTRFSYRLDCICSMKMYSDIPHRTGQSEIFPCRLH